MRSWQRFKSDTSDIGEDNFQQSPALERAAARNIQINLAAIAVPDLPPSTDRVVQVRVASQIRSSLVETIERLVENIRFLNTDFVKRSLEQCGVLLYELERAIDPGLSDVDRHKALQKIVTGLRYLIVYSSNNTRASKETTLRPLMFQ